MTPENTPALSTFPKTWTARILTAPPLIAPARQFVYPLYVPGEEDAMARGALLLDIKPANAPNFLATCALGYRDPSLPTGIHPCPRPDDLLAIAGGYAYLIDTQNPTQCLHLPLRPVTQVLSAPSTQADHATSHPGLILLAGFHHVAAIGPSGLLWESARLSWEGVTLISVSNGQLHGLGWNMHTDREVPFTIDLKTGQHSGGGYA